MEEDVLKYLRGQSSHCQPQKTEMRVATLIWRFVANPGQPEYIVCVGRLIEENADAYTVELVDKRTRKKIKKCLLSILNKEPGSIEVKFWSNWLAAD